MTLVLLILLAWPRDNAVVTYLDGSTATFRLANCAEIAAGLEAAKHVTTKMECL